MILDQITLIGKTISRALLAKVCCLCERATFDSELCLRCQPVLQTGSHRCHVCFEPGDSPCAACRYLPLPFQRARFLWLYADTARKVIQQIKYRPSLPLCREVGRLLAHEIPRLFDNPQWDAIYFIPASRFQLRWRGFDQSKILVDSLREFGRGGELTVLRNGTPAPRAWFSPAERLKRIPRFLAPRIPGAKVLLLDDVVTTGLSVAAAAHALKTAGASQVDLISLCRAPNWRNYRFAVAKRLAGSSSKNE